jgi:hypothetical protein
VIFDPDLNIFNHKYKVQMKKYFIIGLFVTTAVIFYNCHGAKKSTGSVAVRATTYESGIQTLIAANCSPCHFPAKGGNKEPFDSYDKAKANIDNMIRRIELNPADKGFMPFKHPKLSDSTIAVFRKWRDDGLKQN